MLSFKKKDNILNKIKRFYHKKIKRNRLKFNLMETIIFMLITFAFGLVVGGVVMYGKGYFGHHTTTAMNEFISTYNDIVNSYYEEVDEDKLLESGINGMLHYLGDPYTVFMSSDTAEEFNDSVEGIYHGIGAQIKYDEKSEYVVIEEVFEASPAEKAGLKKDDMIIKVNDIDAKKMSVSKVAELVKGKDGTSVSITIRRGEEEKVIKVERDTVDNISVASKIIDKDDKKVGYIAISLFASNTYKQFKDELEKIEKEGIDSLIIDVRGNSGGYLTTVTDIISLFVEKGKPIYQLKTKDKLEVIYDKTDTKRNYRIAVLVNSGSASASEVLTGALKETYGAKIVGINTYGKGKVQKLYTLSNGSIVKYTYQEWLTPKGNYIDSVGIKPDYEEYLKVKEEKDNQLEKALEVIVKEEW